MFVQTVGWCLECLEARKRVRRSSRICASLGGRDRLREAYTTQCTRVPERVVLFVVVLDVNKVTTKAKCDIET